MPGLFLSRLIGHFISMIILDFFVTREDDKLFNLIAQIEMYEEGVYA